MEMPLVNTCSAETCAYNHGQACRALAITVGDQHHAICDTFFHSSTKGGSPSVIGKVGACKVSACVHNVDFECQASGITVGDQGDLVDCLTYQPR